MWEPVLHGTIYWSWYSELNVLKQNSEYKYTKTFVVLKEEL